MWIDAMANYGKNKFKEIQEGVQKRVNETIGHKFFNTLEYGIVQVANDSAVRVINPI